MKKLNFWLLASLFVSSLAFTACSSGGDDGGSNPEDSGEKPAPAPAPKENNKFSIVGGDTYKLSMVNNGSGNTYFATADENNPDKVTRLNALLTASNDALIPATVMYDDNENVRSITVDDVSYVFNVNESNNIDVTMVSGENTQIFTDVAPMRTSAPQITTRADVGDAFMASMSLAINNMNVMLDVVGKVNSIVIEDPESPFNAIVVKVSAAITSVTSDMTAFVSAEVVLVNVTAEEFQTVISTLSENIPALEEIANKTVTEMETSVQEIVSTTDETATENTESGEGAIVSGTGKLKATLTWRYGADIDLHIFEPGFTGGNMSYYSADGQGHIYYAEKRNTFTDGYLDFDNTAGYYINPENQGETDYNKAAIENVYWETVLDGVYYVYLHYYASSPASWCENVTEGPCNVALFVDGVGKSKTVEMTRDYNSSMLYIGKVTFPGGVIDFTSPEPASANYMMMKFMSEASEMHKK